MVTRVPVLPLFALAFVARVGSASADEISRELPAAAAAPEAPKPKIEATTPKVHHAPVSDRKSVV